MTSQPALFSTEEKEETSEAAPQAPQQSSARVRSSRRRKKLPRPGLCLVCTADTADGPYCPEHPASTYRLIPCHEPTCAVVAVRSRFGQGFTFACPEHSAHQASEPAPALQSPRQAVKELIARRRAALDTERTRPKLPPRPPNNIGHYR